MLTTKELEDLINTISDRQADRLVRSLDGMEAFLARPEERDVTFELTELTKALVALETIAKSQ